MTPVTKQTRDLLAKITGNNQQLIRWFESLQDNNAELPDIIEEIQQDIVEINIAINAIEAEIDNIDEEILALQNEISGLVLTEPGQATIDFGAWPGSNEASVLIPNESASSDWYVNAYIMSNDSTDDHDATDHQYIGNFMTLTAKSEDETGITIMATSPYKLQGTFKLRYEQVS